MTLKFFTPTFLFYCVAAASIVLLNKVFPSGPCTPGLGIFAFLLLVPVSAVMVLKNIYRAISKTGRI